jgi:glycosyltransferase involved in cell wall biosynthesis
VSNHDLPSYYSVVDVLENPSLRDGLPSVLLEVMAYGKAVIATPVGGVFDVVSNCENGRIVTVNNVSSLSTVPQKGNVRQGDAETFGQVSASCHRKQIHPRKWIECQSYSFLNRKPGLKV